MPSVRTRRSTRVFVPKTVPKTEGRRSSSRALRSVKNEDWLRSSSDSSELPWLGSDDGCSEPDSPETCAHVAPEIGTPFHKMFGNVYYRKRRKCSTPEPPTPADFDHGKYGIVFKRNKQRKKSKVDRELPQEGRSRLDLEAERQKLLEAEFTSPMALIVLVKISLRGCSDRFTRLLLSMLSWLRTVGERFLYFMAFLQSSPLVSVFSAQGIDLLPLSHRKNNSLHTTSLACGICIIHGVWQSVPMLSVDFAALPFYFRGLHLVLALHMFRSSSYSFRTPGHATDSSSDDEWSDEYESLEIGDSADAGCSGAKIDVYVNLSVKNTNSSSLVSSSESFSEASFFSNMKSRKQIQQRRKGRVMHFPNSSFLNSVEPILVRPLSFRDSDFLSLREELNDASSPLWSYHKHRKLSKKTPIERIKELKAALAEVKHNIDSITCHAIILVVDTNCCWREARADVTLEQASSSDWCIAVKTQGSTRYTFKAQEMRPSVVNRYTHAYMWSVEDGWKLEFCDRWDWLVFKEMHTECRERNVCNVQEGSPRMIPIPGVTEVPSYSKDADASFVRPNAYIRVTVDEVERAMNGEIAYYDMDSGDDEWLGHLNSSSFEESSHISEENFEKIIFAFERELYDTGDEFISKERALDLCENIGKRDLVAAAYDYWLKKRNKKRAGGVPLVRIFQAPRKRSQVIAKHFLRKKRSFKRQRSQVERSHVGRGMSEFILEDMAMDTKQRLQAADNSAKRAMESAIFLRSRAQMLMENADLVVYKSVIALKIAEALRVEFPDLSSCILD